MFDRNVIVASAGFAFILSAIAGIAGGVPAVTLFLRALAWAIAFAAFSAAAMTVVRRYLPELLPDRSGSPTASGAAETGTGVNIVLPEEPPDGYSYGDGGEPEDGAYDDGEPEDLDGDIVEEVTEVSDRIRGDTSAGIDDDGGFAGASGSVDEISDVGELVGTDSADALPDLDTFSDTFAGPVGSIDEGPDRSRGSRTGDEQDPVIMAKAVRTILKKDQEGSR